MSDLDKFFNFLAGVDSRLLSSCPQHERRRYTSVGALVLLTGLFSSMACSYALFTVFERVPIALLFGLLWGVMIVNVDRLMLATFPKLDPLPRQVLHAAPRLIFATLIGITIAHPITLRLFDPEIIDQIAQDTEVERRRIGDKRDKDLSNARVQAQLAREALPEWRDVDRLTKEIGDSHATREKWNTDLLAMQNDVKCEADGTCGTHQFGALGVTATKKAAYEETKERYGVLESRLKATIEELTNAQKRWALASKDVDQRLNEQEEAIQSHYRKSIERLDSSQRTSFLSRSNALGTIGDAKPKAAVTRWFVSVLFLWVEVVPVLLTIIIPADSADRLAAEIQVIFAKRIPVIAQEFVSPLLHPRGHPVPVPIDRAVPVDAEESAALSDDVLTSETAGIGLGKGELLRNILIVVMTLAIAAGMPRFGYSLVEAVEAASLFVAIVAFAVDKHSHRWLVWVQNRGLSPKNPDKNSQPPMKDAI